MANDLPRMAKKVRQISSLLANDFLDKYLLQNTLILKGQWQNNTFRDGKNGDDAKIGTYSTKPTSISVKAFPRKTFTTDNGKRKRVGRAKSVYFKGGYKQFRGAVGRQNKFVDLNLSSSLFSSIQVIKVTRGYVAVGIRDRKELLKVGGAIKKYGKKTFRVPKRLIKEMKQRLENDLTKELNKIINGK